MLGRIGEALQIACAAHKGMALSHQGMELKPFSANW
jgi:hypothetical protein